MVRDGEALRRFKEDLIGKDPQRPFLEALKIYEALWKEAVTLGVLPLADPPDGMEKDIELARMLNSLKTTLPK